MCSSRLLAGCSREPALDSRGGDPRPWPWMCAGTDCPTSVGRYGDSKCGRRHRASTNTAPREANLCGWCTARASIIRHYATTDGGMQGGAITKTARGRKAVAPRVSQLITASFPLTSMRHPQFESLYVGLSTPPSAGICTSAGFKYRFPPTFAGGSPSVDNDDVLARIRKPVLMSRGDE